VSMVFASYSTLHVGSTHSTGCPECAGFERNTDVSASDRCRNYDSFNFSKYIVSNS
jgi:hypothetical protein